MDETISAADANRSFSILLRKVREGRSYVVTSHGKPVARLVPAEGHKAVAAVARGALFDRLENQPVTRIGRWKRDELYDNQ